ncbi:MAG: GIY-YIG nuclease family protein [Candidatus Omnitrophota bacterium]|jgi:putative endonuclease
MECKLAYVYILTNKSNRVLYTGSTDNLKRRINVHKKAYCNGFTNKYNLNKLVCYEAFTDIISARLKECQIKGWVREKKIKLIESMNSKWEDLYKVC